MSAFLAVAKNDWEQSLKDFGILDAAFISPCGGLGYSSNKRFVADFYLGRKTRYFRNRNRAERWARRFTNNIRHL